LTQDLQYVGGSYPVHDVVQKVTGELVYGSDFAPPGTLHAKLVLSPIPHGVVRSIDVSRAEALPGVVKVFSSENAPMVGFSRARIHPGQDMSFYDETLFSRHVRFVGDRVAAVVATSLATAEAAAALVDIEYEELEPLLSVEAALAPGATPIHEAGNLVYEHEIERGERPAAADDAIVVASAATTPRVHHAALEPHVCIAQGHSSGGMTIWTTSQGAYAARTVVAELLELEYHRVRVIKLPMGGSFGGKTEYIVEPVTAFLAHALCRPVKLLLSREECMIATMVRPATRTSIRTASTADGVLLDFEADTTLDSGGFAASTPDYSVHMCKKVTKAYRVPHYRHQGRAVYTTTPVGGAARGWGAPEMAVATELHMDRLAATLRMDPVELRLKNMVEPFDTDLVTGLPLGDARVRECLERGAVAFDWKARRARPAGRGRIRRGIGVAVGAHKNGMFGAFPEASNMSLKMNEDGTFELSASLHDTGCGVVTAMRIIVAEVLGVHPDLVAAGEADTATTPFDYGTYGSRVTYVCGECARVTAGKVKQRLLEAAADLLREPLERLTVREGAVHVRGDRARANAYRDVARLGRMRHVPSIAASTTYYAVSNPASYSVQFAEVEVDCATGLTAVTDFLAVVDIGRAINRGMCEAQCQGAAQMGIGYALCEDLSVDEHGRAGIDGFKNYHIVNAPDMPDVQVLLIEHDGDDGPFGAKSVGEIAVVPTAAAVVNAVNNALGTALADLPLIPERIMAALHGEEVKACNYC
jgi:CO/xanthine dehydrogenase Mo-binding subunit